ncbi:hypothetical protein Y032_0006g3045 [Ancylostoma ceylanicum]|uniref:EGF-like domain-containing protein n=1 Tax=Ancylostoma ceylanicum TaxID=53326 RepID=A0A016VS59_9BILA|nr:hypothetical protein Y032_0006g3045 [Ancylostoma ceylanicum]
MTTANCSVPCNDPNEVRKLQGLKDVCRPTCESRNFTELCDEPKHLRFACECKPGYILDEVFGKCVPIEECKGEETPTEATTQVSEKSETSGATEMTETTKMSETTKMPETSKPIVPEESKCGENEVFNECSKKCGLQCHLPSWDECEFPGPCVPRCECKEGYARDKDDKCVPEEECLSGNGEGVIVPCNHPNEVRKLHGLNELCRPTCENRNFTELCVEPKFLRFACECKPGYILNEVYGTCVPVEECKTARAPTGYPEGGLTPSNDMYCVDQINCTRSSCSVLNLSS